MGIYGNRFIEKENSLEENYNNLKVSEYLSKMNIIAESFNAIAILEENNSLLEFDLSAIKTKIKEKWQAFVKWIKELIGKIIDVIKKLLKIDKKDEYKKYKEKAEKIKRKTKNESVENLSSVNESEEKEPIIITARSPLYILKNGEKTTRIEDLKLEQTAKDYFDIITRMISSLLELDRDSTEYMQKAKMIIIDDQIKKYIDEFDSIKVVQYEEGYHGMEFEVPDYVAAISIIEDTTKNIQEDAKYVEKFENKLEYYINNLNKELSTKDFPLQDKLSALVINGTTKIQNACGRLLNKILNCHKHNDDLFEKIKKEIDAELDKAINH